MIATWMLYCIATTLLLALAALITDRAVRLWLPVGRWVWTLALGAAVLLGTLAWFAPSTAAPAVPATYQAHVAQAEGALGESGSATTTDHVTAPPLRDPERFGRWLLLGWLAMSTVVLGSLIASGLTLRQQRRRWRRSVVDGTPVLITDGLGPAVVDFLRPVIALPPWTLDLDPQMRRLILAHEQEHLRAWDQRLLLLSLLVPVLAPWNLPLWWMVRRLRHAIELDCDARVLRRGADVKAYGSLLLDVGRRPSSSHLAIAAFAEPVRYLEDRVQAMVTRRPRRGWLVGSVLAGASGLLVLAACETPRPVGPGGEVDDARVAEARTEEAEVAPVPEPVLARMIADSIARRHPAAYEGLDADQAVWFHVDNERTIRESWVGPRFSDSAWRRWLTEHPNPRHITLPRVMQVPVAADRSVEVIWAKESLQWKWSKLIEPEHQTKIRDTLLRAQPEVMEHGVPEGHAVWVVEGAVPAAQRIEGVWSWVAPAIPDQKAQWEYLRQRVPENEAEVLMTANFEVTGESGQRIPVVMTTAMNPVPR